MVSRSLSEGLLPVVEPVGQRGAGLIIGFGQGAREAADRTPTDGLPGDLKADELVEPAVDRRPRRKVSERRLGSEDLVDGTRDHRRQQVSLVDEVVAELPLADFGIRPHIVKARRRDAALEHERGRAVHDPLAGRPPFARGWFGAAHARHWLKKWVLGRPSRTPSRWMSTFSL
jgi:hypothetical protein